MLDTEVLGNMKSYKNTYCLPNFWHQAWKPTDYFLISAAKSWNKKHLFEKMYSG